MILMGLGGAWPIKTLGSVGSLIGLGLVLLGTIQAASDQGLRRALLITGLPIVMALLLVGALGTWIYARFMVLGLTFVAIAASGGLLWLYHRSRAVGVVGGVCLALGWSIVLWNLWTIPRQPVRELVALIPDDGSVVASSGIKDMSLVVAWYLPDSRRRLIDADAHHQDADERLKDPRIRWVIHAYPERSGSWPETGDFERTLPGWIDQMDGTLRLERTRE